MASAPGALNARLADARALTDPGRAWPDRISSAPNSSARSTGRASARLGRLLPDGRHEGDLRSARSVAVHSGAIPRRAGFLSTAGRLTPRMPAARALCPLQGRITARMWSGPTHQ
ncbi:MAG: DUF1589 domain-containing protein [Deltaproteobacteria bacterium]|nr:DUF1589 domain-containing protein [Deltaproteobacteria bacterium]